MFECATQAVTCIFIAKNMGTLPLNKFWVALEELGHSFNTLDETTIATANLNSPLILAEISPGRFEVIDGNHRVEKARRIGAKSILAYRVGPDVHHHFFTSERAYRIYVDYWNSKLKELGQLAKL